MKDRSVGSAETEVEPPYDPAEPQSARRLVDYHLHQLGLGDEWSSTWRGRPRQGASPEGTGRCRAAVLTEAAWPDGAELCVMVEWTPDPALRRNPDTGHVPAGADEHWRDRLAATADALETLGYVVERTRPPWSPHTHWYAELLVYRMAPGLAPARLPAGAWSGKAANPPHYLRRSWDPDPDPCRVIEDTLWRAGVLGRPRYSFDPPTQSSQSGTCYVRTITQTVWPPDAEVCAWVSWKPADSFKRSSEDGDMPVDTHEHWTTQTARVTKALQQDGYTVRWRARDWNPRTEDRAEALVYREKQPGIPQRRQDTPSE